MTKYIIIGSSLIAIVVLSYFRNKRAKNKIVHVIEGKCTGCRRCLKKCRNKALEVVSGDAGLRVALGYPEKCAACRDCILVCRFDALELVTRKQTK